MAADLTRSEIAESNFGEPARRSRRAGVVAWGRGLPALAATTLLALSAACAGAAPTPLELTESSDVTVVGDAEARPPRVALVPVAPPGSRLTLSLPASAARDAHGLRYRDTERGLLVAVTDATVEAGTERAVAEAGLSALGERAELRPIAMAGVEGVEVILRGPDEHVRAVTLFADGALARLLLAHRPDDALLAERILETVRFDPSAAVDPRAALNVRCGAEGLTLLPVSNEQLLFRERPQAIPFPSAEASVEVVWAPFTPGAGPTGDRVRGQLLGARFAGIPLEGTEVAPIEGGRLEGFEIVSTTPAEDGRLALYGAYLEDAGGAWLVRASVAAARAPEWGPRFRALVRSLERP